MSDQNLQDGAPAAATAGRPVGGAGKCHGADPPGKTYQCAAGPYGCPSGLRLNCGQLRGSPDEDTLPLPLHPGARPPAGLLVEKLGRALGVHAPSSAAPRMTSLMPARVAFVSPGDEAVVAVPQGALKNIALGQQRGRARRARSDAA